MRLKQYLNENFDPLAILTGKDKKANKRQEDIKKLKDKIIKDLTNKFIKYKNELQRLDKTKYKENTKRIAIGATKDDFQSFDMSIGTINDRKKQRTMRMLLDTLRAISDIEPKLKSAIDKDDIKDAIEPLIDLPYVDISRFAERIYKSI